MVPALAAQPLPVSSLKSDRIGVIRLPFQLALPSLVSLLLKQSYAPKNVSKNKGKLQACEKCLPLRGNLWNAQECWGSVVGQK